MNFDKKTEQHIKDTIERAGGEYLGTSKPYYSTKRRVLLEGGILFTEKMTKSSCIIRGDFSYDIVRKKVEEKREQFGLVGV